MNRLKEIYQKELVPALMKELNLANVMQVPCPEKVVINIGLGEAMDNPKAMDAAVGDLSLVTGQKPIITKARKHRKFQAARGTCHWGKSNVAW